MGVDEAHIDIIASCGVPRSAQYKMAGNSIVVDVLYHIFRTAFIPSERGSPLTTRATSSESTKSRRESALSLALR